MSVQRHVTLCCTNLQIKMCSYDPPILLQGVVNSRSNQYNLPNKSKFDKDPSNKFIIVLIKKNLVKQSLILILCETRYWRMIAAQLA